MRRAGLSILQIASSTGLPEKQIATLLTKHGLLSANETKEFVRLHPAKEYKRGYF